MSEDILYQEISKEEYSRKMIILKGVPFNSKEINLLKKYDGVTSESIRSMVTFHINVDKLWINKLEDEWYIVQHKKIYYKCDSYKGLIQYLENFLNPYRLRELRNNTF